MPDFGVLEVVGIGSRPTNPRPEGHLSNPVSPKPTRYSPLVISSALIRLVLSDYTDSNLTTLCFSTSQHTQRFLTNSTMSSASATKLSPALKSLINAPHARGASLPSPPHIKSLFQRVEKDAQSKDIGIRIWLCLSTASLVTMNSPAAVCDLYTYATRSMSKTEDKAIAAAVSW